MISGYTNLLNYHHKVANEPRIMGHYAHVNTDEIFGGHISLMLFVNNENHLRRLRRSLGFFTFTPLNDLR